MTNIEKQTEMFFINLKNRFHHSAISEIFERCISCDYFVACSLFIDTFNIIPEYPLSDNTKEKIDCVIKGVDNKIVEAIEFKFFRPIPSNRNKPQTKLFGQFVKDIYKLMSFHKTDARKIIIVSDNNMKNYINSQLGIFDHIEKNDFSIHIRKEELDRKPETFQKNIHPYQNRNFILKRIFYDKISMKDTDYIVSIFYICNI
jgi:hypothetical protein